MVPALTSYGAGLFRAVFVLVGQAAAQPVDDHENNGRRQTPPYDNQQKLHWRKLTDAADAATPAMLGRPFSAELAAGCPTRGGISAYLPFVPQAAMVAASEKEDASWMILAEPGRIPPVAAASAFLWPLALSCWFCFMHCSQAVAPARLSIRQPLAQPTKARQSWKILPLFNRLPQPWANNTKATPTRTARGVRCDARAFRAFMTCVCTRPSSDLFALHAPILKGAPC